MDENSYGSTTGLDIIAMLLPACLTPTNAHSYFGPRLKELTQAQADLAAIPLAGWVFDLFLAKSKLEDLSDEECARLQPIMTDLRRRMRRRET